MAERAAMKNIKDMFSNIFPDVPCRKRKDKESISQYLKDVYSILFTILKNKKTTENVKDSLEIIYVFLTIFLYLLKCPQSLILSALRAFCFCGKPHISRSIFLYFRYQSWLNSW